MVTAKLQDTRIKWPKGSPSYFPTTAYIVSDGGRPFLWGAWGAEGEAITAGNKLLDNDRKMN